ncbi:endo-1,3;1,4-beta-D-glucanase-like [Malus domestica]|uniref:endo-1,3;1,4-beta-D-glucanase-like n=1 Tax=Malus domestica TaxID=3750 RepID=UPI003976F93E
MGLSSFSLSAKVVVELSKHDYIKAASLCHPSFVTLDDIKAVKIPTQILGAEIDGTSPPELVKQFEEALAARSEITSQVKIFQKVEHGWTTRYNVEDEAACKAAEEAYEDLMEWFLNLLYYEEAFSDISE